LISDSDIRGVLAWERNWFRRVKQTALGEVGREDGRGAVLPKLIARRLLRHAVWYLRARGRDTNDFQAAWVLLVCLRKV